MGAEAFECFAYYLFSCGVGLVNHQAAKSPASSAAKKGVKADKSPAAKKPAAKKGGKKHAEEAAEPAAAAAVVAPVEPVKVAVAAAPQEGVVDPGA